MPRPRRVEPALLGAALLGAACAVPATRASSAVPSGQLYQVQRGTIVHEMHASGTVVPARWASLTPRVEGYVAEVLVAPGDHVTAGQPLLALESGILDAAVTRAAAPPLHAGALSGSPGPRGTSAASC